MVKNQYENEINIAKIRMLCLMYGKIKWDKIRNDDIRKRIGVVFTVEKMVGNMLRLFEHVKRSIYL